MIEQPHRSVTRFFIPLIDVLILLFCIFLLMPYVQTPEVAPKPPEAPANVEELARDVLALRKERDRLIEERARALDRLAIRVLEIDRATGRLYDTGAERVEIASAADAQKLIEAHAQTTAGRDAYFLFLFPRDSSGFPLEKQAAAYAKWFQHVPHGFDNPRGGR